MLELGFDKNNLHIKLCFGPNAYLPRILLAMLIADLIDDIEEILITSWYIKWRLLLLFSPYFMLLVAFVGFVCWNGSIVLGTYRLDL